MTDEERETLELWARRPKSSQALALRCQIILAAADGETSKNIAQRLGVTGSTVGKWRVRFACAAPRRLSRRATAGKPRSIMDDEI